MSQPAFIVLLTMVLHLENGAAVNCPAAVRFGNGPPASCTRPTDPNNLPASRIENWLTKEVFDDLFPHANIGWGPNPCSPYSYEAFKIAVRYFPRFGTESPNTQYNEKENSRRDVAAFFAHVIQETGENDGSVYQKMSKQDADSCFYRGGFFNWFEGGPTSPFLPNGGGHSPTDGQQACTENAKYCASSAEINYWYPCVPGKCYFGRGALQVSYNYNYGQFQQFLKTKNINIDLLSNPNLLITNMNPPLAMLASLWFYMTPQPPKPAMHDIILGKWEAGDQNKAAGFSGPIFGPTSLVINNECGGEDAATPGGPGESRRIKAFKWFCNYFQVPYGPEKSLTCNGMPGRFPTVKHDMSWGPDYSTTGLNQACNCKPASYSGIVPYFDPKFYPADFVAQNDANRQRCVKSIYENPALYSLSGQACLNVPPPNNPVTASTARPSQGTTTTTRLPTQGSSTTRAAPTTTTRGGGANGVSCKGRPDGEFIRDPNDCQVFYRCVYGERYEYRCNAPTVFNAAISSCDHRNAVPECNGGK